MDLISFRITNYRCVNDSGEIEVRKRTGLVGRNESGKTNLLLALRSLNPSEGISSLSFGKDFPRDRHRNEFSEDIRVVATTWHLNNDEQAYLVGIFPRAAAVQEVTIGRDYSGKRWVGFKELPALAVDAQGIQESTNSLKRSLHASRRGKDEVTITSLDNAIMALDAIENVSIQEPSLWATTSKQHLQAFDQAVALETIELSDIAVSSREIID
jgi:energy-coupling factor transporter ATP-binding protein EcfA2